MVLVLSIKDGFYKIEKSIFRPNYARYEKMLRSKIVHFKKIYKFYFDHFLEKRTVFILIKKTLLKIKKNSTISLKAEVLILFCYEAHNTEREARRPLGRAP